METKRFTPEELASGMAEANASKPTDGKKTMRSVVQPVSQPKKEADKKVTNESNSGKKVAATVGAAVVGSVAGGAAVAGVRQLKDEDVYNPMPADEDTDALEVTDIETDEVADIEVDDQSVMVTEEPMEMPHAMSIDLDGDGTVDLIAIDETGDGIGDTLFARMDVEDEFGDFDTGSNDMDMDMDLDLV